MLELLAQEAGGSPSPIPLLAFALFGVFVFMLVVVIFRGRS